MNLKSIIPILAFFALSVLTGCAPSNKVRLKEGDVVLVDDFWWTPCEVTIQSVTQDGDYFQIVGGKRYFPIDRLNIHIIRRKTSLVLVNP